MATSTRPTVIAIAGCSGSGKTTLAAELTTQLEATLFPLDLYYRDLSQFPLDARHMGIEVLGISLVTNPAAGVTAEAINHEEVMDIGRQVEGRFTALLSAIIPVLGGIAI